MKITEVLWYVQDKNTESYHTFMCMIIHIISASTVT